MKLLELLPAALAEAEEAAAWYAERDPRVAVRFTEELDTALNQIMDAPHRWPAHLHGTQRVRLTRFPYLVVYREDPTRILVVAVAHTRRKPGLLEKEIRPVAAEQASAADGASRGGRPAKR